MKIKLNQLTRRLEFKTSLYFGIGAFTIAFLTGLIKGVDFLNLIKRIFVAEIFYIPIGYGVGYLIAHYFPFEQFKTNEINNITRTEVITQQEQTNTQKEKENEKEEAIISEIAQDVPKNELSPETEEIELNEEIKPDLEYDNLAEKVKRVSSISPKDLGKHLIIENKKIINDPEAMAQAIRTMMNKE